MASPRVLLVPAVAGALLGAGGCSREVHLGSIGDGAANLLWSATFEPGDLSEWTSDGQGEIDANIAVTPTVTAAVAHKGRYAGKSTVMPPALGMDSINYFSRLQPSPGEAYYGAWVYIAPGFAVGTWLSVVHFRGSYTGDSTNTFPVWDINLYPQPDGSLAAQLYNYVSGKNLQQSIPIVVPIGSWVHFEVFLKKTSDATGQFKVWQDDVEILDEEGVVTAQTDWLEWSVGGASNNVSPSPGLVYIDDATISVSRLGQGN
jgi:hypothetical protein